MTEHFPICCTKCEKVLEILWYDGWLILLSKDHMILKVVFTSRTTYDPLWCYSPVPAVLYDGTSLIVPFCSTILSRHCRIVWLAKYKEANKRLYCVMVVQDCRSDENKVNLDCLRRIRGRPRMMDCYPPMLLAPGTYSCWISVVESFFRDDGPRCWTWTSLLLLSLS